MYNWIFTIFSGLLFFLGISLIIRRIAASYNFLGVHFLLVSYLLLMTFFNLSGLMVEYPHLFRTGLLVGYLFGPTYLFLILSTIRPDFKLRKVHLWHLLPFFLHLFELGPFWISTAEEKRILANLFQTLSKTSLLTSDYGYFSYREHIIFQFSLGIGYTLASLYAVWPLLQERRLSSGIVQKKVLTWMKLDIFLKLFSFSFVLVIFLFFWVFPQSFHKFHFYIFFLSTLLSALLLLLYPEILFVGHYSFNATDKPQGENASAEAGVDVTINSTPSGSDESAFSVALKKIFEENFANEALDIPLLARLMHLSERSLYRKTKDTFGKSPAQALLDFRMGKVCLFIQKDPNRAIAQVAKEVGITNYGSFSSAFCERYGMLPREFQKKCKADGQSPPESL